MKLRHPTLIRAAARAGAALIRCWIGSLRLHYCPLGADVDPRRPGYSGRYVYAFWHETLLLPANHFGGAGAYTLISRHADGELIAQVCQRLGIQAVRGSSTRGGVEAVRRLLKLTGPFRVGATPDGPRGPRRQVQPGLVYLASRLGVPIVPTGFGFERPWRMRSWDRFAVPRPFTRATCVTAEPVVVPPDAGRELLEEYRGHVEAVMHDVTAAAERWAEERIRPTPVHRPLPEALPARRRAG
jgi:lysophospholipid acyltransferase (LPLAT)-like uncharacterized protein